MNKRIPWLYLTAVTLSSAVLPGASAEEAVEHISVTASRSERDINEIASYVSFIDSDTMQQQLMTDIRDLVRYEPGVSVEGGAALVCPVLISAV
uniref:TonB-dependent receptor n=1 Tax=Rheinheimera sp. BAL341 TaxID=1708203 RepID=A0A486XUP8_9GAMM